MFLLLLIALSSTSSFAKDISLKWDPIDDAVRYVLEIQSHSGEMKKRVVKPGKNKWEGDLPFGIYTYRVHAIDRVERPGEWSEASPLVVLPSSPRPLSPEDGADIRILEKSDSKIFKWESVPEAQEYQLSVLKDGTSVLTRTVEGTEADLRELGPGEYTWTVLPVIRAPDRAPASLAGRKWEGQASKPASFEIAYQKLDEPKAITPVGYVMPPASGKLRFQWKKVPNAKGYEVTLEKDAEEKGIAPPAPKTFRVATNGMTAIVPEMGSYRWKVRALASVTSVESATSEATADFVMSPSDPDGKKGYLGLSTLFAPYKYGVKTPAGQGFLDSQSFTLRLAGEIWLKKGWGLGAGFQNTTAQIQGSSYSWMDLEVFGKYYVPLPKSLFGFLLLPKAGFEQRQYLFFSPAGTGTFTSGQGLLAKKATTLGFAMGFDLRKQFAERWSVGMKVNYFKPMTLSGVESGSTLAGASNLSMGLQGFYWYSKSWGFGVGGFFDRRSLSYTSPTSGLQEVNLDSTQFFGSILLRI